MEDAFFSNIAREGFEHCDPSLALMSYDGFPVFDDDNQFPNLSSIQSDYNEERGMGFSDDCCAFASSSSSFPSFPSTRSTSTSQFVPTKHSAIGIGNGSGITGVTKLQIPRLNKPPRIPEFLSPLHFVTSCIVSDVRMTIDQYLRNKVGFSAQYNGKEWTWTVSYQRKASTDCSFTISMYCEEEKDATRKCVVEVYQTAGDQLFFATTVVPDIGERMQYLR